MNREELIEKLEKDIENVCTSKRVRIEHLIWFLKQICKDGTFLWSINYADYPKVYEKIKKNLLII